MNGEKPDEAGDGSVALTVVRPLDPARTITIVSGMPRSGTSLMMQILEAAGFPIAHDRVRAADEDNPRGYYELEAVKRIREDVAFLRETVGMAVKVVAPLLPALPPDLDYRILFVERDLDEILASQRAMLVRLGREDGRVDDESLKRAYLGQLDRVKAWMVEQQNVEARFVPHAGLIGDPEETIAALAGFLRAAGHEIDSGAEGAMLRVVDSTLHRHRAPR